jgi:hypothetical protein
MIFFLASIMFLVSDPLFIRWINSSLPEWIRLFALYFSDSSESKKFSSSDLKAILKLSWYKNEFDIDSDRGISVVHSIFNWLLIGRENLVGGDEVEDGEDDVETADCAGFFLINHIGRGAEGFAEDGERGGDEDDIETADCEEFFVNHAGRCAVSLHSANLVVVIAAVKTASIYRSWACRINLGSFFNNHSWGIVISLIVSSNSISCSKKALNR